MAYTLEEFRKKMEEERRMAYKPRKPTRDELEDAYYDALSDAIDKHPIGLPGRLR